MSAPGPVRRALDPLAEFLREEAAGGAVLLAAVVVALLWANLAPEGSYQDFWHHEVTIGAGSLAITEDLQHWVNDGLMAIFFFVVGLEIKRELVVGELRDRRAATLPALAALGGVIVPILVYTAIVHGGPGGRGWAIPMATDIAFAVGLMALLGDRVAPGVKLFVLAVAIVDDVLAITVIAVFYTARIHLVWLAAALVGLLVVVGMRRAGVVQIWAYVLVGVVVWACDLESGVHATIAGVALGLLTPARPVRGREVLRDLEHRLHPVSSFVIVPVFALANAGIDFRGGVLGAALHSPVAWGVTIGLVAGKLAGVSAGTLLGLRLGVGVLPAGMERRQVWGVAALCGVGFTVSLFVAGLAFPGGALEDAAKVGIFAGSLVAGCLGSALLRAGGPYRGEKRR